MIDYLIRLMGGFRRQTGVTTGGYNIAMPQEFLHLLQVHTCFNQMGCIAMAQRVRGDVFFKPQE